MTLKSIALQFARVLGIFGGLVCSAAARGESAVNANLPADYVEEAPLPEGFPPPSEPGKVVEKIYPVLRSYSATGPGSFMKCFGYLSVKQHKMTAPVVMECKPDADPSKHDPGDEMPVPIERMHFLLEKNSLDTPKVLGPIRVADMPPMRVLSIAFRGDSTPEAVKKGQAAIESRLKEMSGIERAGEYRILGYNSPMLERSKNFWELQLPIAEKHNTK
jgi:hypothetical protein